MHGNEKTLTFSTKNFASKKDDNNFNLIFKMANTTITPIGSINQNPTSLGLTQGGANYDAKYATYLKLFSGK